MPDDDRLSGPGGVLLAVLLAALATGLVFHVRCPGDVLDVPGDVLVWPPPTPDSGVRGSADCSEGGSDSSER
jgi:hypothetical protein